MQIAGIGCCLLDLVYKFSEDSHNHIETMVSITPGDGGIIPEGLVFLEDFQKFCNKNEYELIEYISNGNQPDSINLGGPAIVAMVHVSQLLNHLPINIFFEGILGEDKESQIIKNIIKQTPLKCKFHKNSKKGTPKTIVLTEKEKRSFINYIGTANYMYPEFISDEFFNSDIALFGGTALVPPLHDNLDSLLEKVKNRGGLTVVGTVYDFRNQKKDSKHKWPLVNKWENIDVLVMDCEEAKKISGCKEIEIACEFFIKKGVGSFVITEGKKDIKFFAQGNQFKKQSLSSLSVNNYITQLIIKSPKLRCDSTGCGDNFVGGVIASIALQKYENNNTELDMYEACRWGAAAGGFALLHKGGTFLEKERNEKRNKIQLILDNG